MLENVISREDAISRLRRKLLELTDNEKSACQVAAELGILCCGFTRYSDQELREAYRHLVQRNPSISRPALERAANEWQLDRQAEVGTLLSCDTEQMFYETCRGWTDFNNAQLARFCFELVGEEVVVTGDRTLPASSAGRP
jgi:hypothetical protein